MPDPKSRNRMISLRISQSEYESLQQSCRNHGARSLSDFARLALQRVLGNPLPTDPAVVQKMQELDLRLHALEARVTSLLEQR